jgi:hypothetical protein
MWVIQRNSVSDLYQDSIQQSEIRLRSNGMVYALLISKSKEFSQSISRIAAGGDTMEASKYQVWVIY